jgi:hypothetical protein
MHAPDLSDAQDQGGDMAGISDFIQMAAKNLGVPQGAAQAGAGGLLNLVKNQVGGDLFGQLTKVLPDAGNVAANAPAATATAAATAGGGVGAMLGGLAQKAGALLGGSGGAAVGLVGMLQSAGIPADKVAGFVSQFVAFLKSKLSPQLLSGILAKVGELKKLGGG